MPSSFSFIGCLVLVNQFKSWSSLPFQLHLFLSNIVHKLIFIFMLSLPFAAWWLFGPLLVCMPSIILLLWVFAIILAFSSSFQPQMLPQKPILAVDYHLVDLPDLLIWYLFGPLFVQVSLLDFLFEGLYLMIFWDNLISLSFPTLLDLFPIF